ncbi:Na+/H+ antiporter subunit E [Crenalkalicoccus roseus]|uniref:Na+/H+ antiporter subunit E n=1 Tax=Crenalkalicoccus roseus TaxID=1485588 RepID=UPI0010822FF9|nr:Na+/H+ antiporter subunit E [Crenalkalicoccus roseus]
MRPNPWNIFAWLRLALLFLWELSLSAAMVIRATLSREIRVRSAIVAIPLTLRSEAGITLLSHLITLTPGTTALHVSDDRRTLYVHAMHAETPERVAASVREGFEAAIRRVLP